MPLNLCMVGTGLIATEHLKAFQKLGGVVPRWVVSRQDDKAREFGQTWGFAHAGSSLDEALADRAVDVVVIASPSEEHAGQTIRSLRAGKHVIVEIPVALSLADAQQVAAVSGETDRRVLVCHTMRSFPAIREIRRRVLAGQFHVSQVVGHFAIPRRRNQSPAGRRNWIDNLLWHHGCHMVDAALWMLDAGEVEDVHAMLGKTHPQFGMATDVSIHFRTPANQLVSLALTYNTEQFCWEMRCHGDEETLTFRNGDLLNEKDEAMLPHRSWLNLVSQNKQMLATLTEGVPSDFDIAQILPSMAVLHRAENSARGNCGGGTGAVSE